ncbi:MAG: hypothetical protein WCT14_10445 [Treponemataceae bacterium]
MTDTAWTAFVAVRESYRTEIDRLSQSLPGLRDAQQRLADEREGGSFPVETPVVYNGALDDVRREDDIRIILVADNPGRREQIAENRRYLVGPSGKLADGFFKAHPELGIDFRRNVLILNKTPIHTPRTAELRELARLGGKEIEQAIADSQSTMVNLIHAFHEVLSGGGSEPIPLWIIGYSELGKKKLFAPFAEALATAYDVSSSSAQVVRFRESILLFRHFSMNQFSADIRKRALPGEPMGATLHRVGTEYRKRELGW